MMDATLEQFQNQHATALSLLGKLKKFLEHGLKLGVAIDPTLLVKLEHASEQLNSHQLKIALIGGFSEGKTSIAAAWMERLDKSSMRISQQESSNEVNVYEVGDDFVLIDTPGLYGFKEQYNADSHAIEKYKDITRKYVSEAHLVLYVMNSTNPIKKSHKDELSWLFRTLDLLPRTVFVLSRFDEVADVEDEDSYQENLGIKRDNVKGRLRDEIAATNQELAEMSIVAVAANPFDLGTEHWLENMEEFKSLSHIGNLQQATAEKIKRSGGPSTIVEQARGSVIRDVLHKELPIAVENHRRLGEEVNRLKHLGKTLTLQLHGANTEISEVRINLRQFVAEYFAGLIMRTEGSTLETFGEFYQREIGADGVMITTRLQSEFERQLSSVTQELNRMRLDFDAEISHFNNTVTKLGKQGINYVVTGKFINNNTILAARDGIASVAKHLGYDLAKMLKFKPWGAVNLAKNINGFLSVAGLLMEAWDSYERMKQEDDFAKTKLQMVEHFNAQRKDLLQMIDAGDFSERFFPEYAVLQVDDDVVSKAIMAQEQLRLQFQQWRSEGETISAEFSRID
jgi:GTP-binding protein EngB required for normal cell division